jgi:hypothetical protein
MEHTYATYKNILYASVLHCDEASYVETSIVFILRETDIP